MDLPYGINGGGERWEAGPGERKCITGDHLLGDCVLPCPFL
jgi:hypothetical protein